MLYFITYWHSASLKRVAFSSTGAEILWQLQTQQTVASLSPSSFLNLLQRQNRPV
jgi:hypothetical protein